MACGEISDAELRDRLQKLGISVGPITDLTRCLYVRRLAVLSQQKTKPKIRMIRPTTPPLPASRSTPVTKTSPTPAPAPAKQQLQQRSRAKARAKQVQVRSITPPLTPPYSPQPEPEPKLDSAGGSAPPPPPDPSQARRPPPPGPSGSSSSATASSPAKATTSMEASRQASQQPQSPQQSVGNIALSVVERQLLSFNKPGHLANDTVFIFQSGQLLFASRSILIIHCPDLTRFLFPSQDRFPITVTTGSTGQSTQYYVYLTEFVVDLKEKISLSQGHPIAAQNLIFEEKPLINSTTLHSCGVYPEAQLTLMVVGTSGSIATSTVGESLFSLNPSLLITHFSLNIKLDILTSDGEQAVHCNPAQQQERLPPHVSNIVHVYDVPFEAFQALLVYLYSGNLLLPSENTHSVVSAGIYIACYIMGKFFHLPSLSQLCLDHIEALLTLESALTLLRYAESIDSTAFYELAMKYLKSHHTP